MEKLWNSNYIKIWTGNFLIHFSFTLIVPLLPLYLSETFGATKDTIGLVLAGYSVVALMIRPIGGYLVDSFPRKTVLLICNFFFVALFFGYIAAGSLTIFAIFRTLHGAPFGATTVAATTVAIDVLPSSRRSEGIGYYGLSNNLSTALGPVLAIAVLNASDRNFTLLFQLSLLLALAGLILDATIKMPEKQPIRKAGVISLDRFFLVEGWREAVAISTYSFSYGVISTYVAIYGKESLQINNGTGVFFMLFAVGLIVSRLTGAHALARKQIHRNAAMGVVTAFAGYMLFAAVPHPLAYYSSAFIIGLGNGHMYPAFQNMFIDLAAHDQRGTANSSILTAWDIGVGLGVLCGGVISEFLGYRSAFLAASLVNGLGRLFYFLQVRGHFERARLR